MKKTGSVTRWLEQLRSDDPKVRDEAARQIWLRYFPRLLELARANLGARVRRREDEEDVLQNMYHGICLRIQRGQFSLEDRNELWRLLVTTTLNKVRTIAKKHTRKSRDVRLELNQADADASTPDWALEQMDAGEPTPLEAALLNEQVELRLQCLSPAFRQIALWRLEGYANQEIADMLDCVERTVERKLELIRKKWQEISWD